MASTTPRSSTTTSPRNPGPANIDPDVAVPELSVSAEQVAFIVVKAREFDQKEPPVAEDDASNPSDDPLITMVDSADDPTEQELVSFLAALSEDAQHELVAMMWLGRGDYTADAWDEAVADARAAAGEHPTPTYLASTPLLGDLLEEGYAALGRSLKDEEAGRL